MFCNESEIQSFLNAMKPFNTQYTKLTSKKFECDKPKITRIERKS